MAWSLVSSATVGNSSTATTSAISTSGADLIVVFCGSYESGAGPLPSGDLTDSASNTWTQVSSLANATVLQIHGSFWYVLAPTTSGTHTFTVADASTFIGMVVMAFTQGSTPTYGTTTHTDNATGSTSLQPGSLGNANDLVIATMNYDAAISGLAIDSTFSTIVHQAYGAGTNEGAAVAWKQVSGATQPTWSWTTSRPGVAQNFSFTGTGGGGGGGVTYTELERSIRGLQRGVCA